MGIKEKFGADAIDVLIYNAGYAQPAQNGNPMGGQLVEEIPLQGFSAAYSVHVSVLLLCAQEVLPAMRRKEKGTILVTGNTMSLRGGPKFGLNAPSKFAQR